MRDHLRDETAKGEAKEVDLIEAQGSDKGHRVPRHHGEHREQGLLPGPPGVAPAVLGKLMIGSPAQPYFPSIVMLPSISLSERLGPKLSSRLLVSTRRPLLAPSVILPTRCV
jgi:hypothetical protein